MGNLLIEIWKIISGENKEAYNKCVVEPFKIMITMNSKVERMLNGIDGTFVDPTKVIYDMRAKMNSEIICYLEGFKGAYYEKRSARKEFSYASIEYLKVIDKMLELPTAPLEKVTENSFLTMLENRDYFVSYGEGESSFLQKLNELIVYYCYEMDYNWRNVCRAKTLIDSKIIK